MAETEITGAPLEEASGLVDWAVYKDGYRQDAGSLDEAYELAGNGGGNFIWLALQQPSTEELQYIAEQFDLHPLAVEDAIHAHQRSKIEIYRDNLFAVLKTARYVDPVEIVEIGEIMVFLGAHFVVSVQHGEGTDLGRVREELERHPDVLGCGPSAVLWAIADRVVDGYVQAIEGLAEDVEQIEVAVFHPDVVAPTERIYKVKREVLEFRRAIDPLGDALLPLANGEVELIAEQTRPYFRDVHDHALRDASRLLNFDDLLRDVLQANVAQVTLRQNEDVRKITAWGAILATITSIAGIYGMNFDNMPELRWANGYYICLGVMVAASVGLYAIFRRRRWL